MRSVQVTLTNDTAYLTEYTAEQYEQLNLFWSYFWEHAWRDRRYKLYLRCKKQAEDEGEWPCKVAGWDGRIRFLKSGAVAAGVFRATRREIKEKLGIRFKVEYERKGVRLLPASAVVDEKYRYQADCVDIMCECVRKGGGTILSATGTGKTKMAGDFFYRVDCQCLFLVDQIDLLYQSQKDIEKWLGEPVGVVGNSRYEPRRVTVATVQTLWRHRRDKVFKKWLRSVRIVIVDELHVQMGFKNFGILNEIKPVARFGLTATLQLKKAPVRFKVWAFAGPVVFEFPLAEGVEKGVLTDGEAIQLRFPAESEDGEYQEDLQREVIENEQKLRACKQIIEYLIKQGKYVMLLCYRVAHLKALDELFDDIPHRIAYGKVKKDLRRKAVTQFEAGKLHLIIANVVFQKGLDVSRLDVVYDVAEQPSKNTANQKFRRGVRLHKDKLKLLYIDQGTQTGRFGRAARSRARALKSQGIPVAVVNVNTVGQAVKAVKQAVAQMTMERSIVRKWRNEDASTIHPWCNGGIRGL